jgi:hypothetical protein
VWQCCDLQPSCSRLNRVCSLPATLNVEQQVEQLDCLHLRSPAILVEVTVVVHHNIHTVFFALRNYDIVRHIILLHSNYLIITEKYSINPC